MKKTLILALFLLFSLSYVSAVCTVTLDDSYNPSGTATATMLCDSHPAESSKSYTITWTNSSGYVLESDTGTTPKADGTNNFFASYVIPSDYVSVYGAGLNATMTGTNLEGMDNTTVASAGTNDLVIQEIGWTEDLYIGTTVGMEFEVVDENGDKVSGASCDVALEDVNSKPIFSGNHISHAGDVHGSFSMNHAIADEGTQYLLKAYCYCGVQNTSSSCVTDGGQVGLSSGSSSITFTTDTWLEVNTLTDKSSYEMKNEIFICANVTNINYSARIPLEIDYQVRCSANGDNNDDTDRALIIESETSDIRGISTSTTQNQCKKFIIPEENHLQGRTSTCYASTNAWVINHEGQRVVGYATTSDNFNITSDELNLESDWQWVDTLRLNSILNLSNYDDINGTGTGNVDIRIHHHGVSTNPNEQEVVIDHAIDLFNRIENITIYNTTGILTEHIDYEIEWLEDGLVEIEIRNVPLTKTGDEWWNITLEFYDFDKRSTVAFEDIANKTGTFKLSVDCPSFATIGEAMTCAISAQVEENQLMEKEVDFTCYILEGNSSTRYSETNFNKMITRNISIINKEFLIPSVFSDSTSNILKCEANYYNIGSRQDTFYDSFVAEEQPPLGGSSGIPGLDGGFVSEVVEKIKDKIEDVTGFEPPSYVIIILICIIITVILLAIILSFSRRNKK